MRGYNQAIELARPLAQQLGLRYADGVIERVRATPALAAGRGRDERRRELAGAFVARSATLRGQRVLLVEDVATTGSTLSAGAEALLHAGASAVVAAVFARDGNRPPTSAP
jgi:predicted amidophosphoribosyltransferase